MRVTAEELIKELMKLEPEANVTFMFRSERNNYVVSGNGLQRVDNFGKHAIVVVEQST
jgi:hypothetical protein